jgi:hypothetical protein
LRLLGGREGPFALATLSLGAAAIHFAVIGEHFEEYWLFGLFFASLGWYQALWAVLYVLRPIPLLGSMAFVVNTGTVALWLWTRTVGVPIGPQAGELEPIGVPDAAASTFEVAIVLGLMWFTASRRRSEANPSIGSPARLVLLTAFVAAVVGVTAVVLFVPGG